MFPASTTITESCHGEEGEILKSWVAVNNDLEVSLVTREGTFLVLANVLCPRANSDGQEALIPVDCYETDDLEKAETRFRSYTSNFL